MTRISIQILIYSSFLGIVSVYGGGDDMDSSGSRMKKSDDTNSLSLSNQQQFRPNPLHVIPSSSSLSSSSDHPSSTLSDPSSPSSPTASLDSITHTKDGEEDDKSRSKLFYSPSSKTWKSSERMNKDPSSIIDHHHQHHHLEQQEKEKEEKDSSMTPLQTSLSSSPSTRKGKEAERRELMKGSKVSLEAKEGSKIDQNNEGMKTKKEEKRNSPSSPSSSSSSFGRNPYLAKSVPSEEEAVMEGMSYPATNYGNGLGAVGGGPMFPRYAMSASPLETNEIEKNPIPFVQRDCCPSARTQIHPKGGVSRNGVILELFNQDNHTQTFWQVSCRETLYSPHCRYLDPSLRPFSKCTQQYGYTYALVREFNAGPNVPWRLDYILIRSGCSCQVRAPQIVIQEHLKKYPPPSMAPIGDNNPQATLFDSYNNRQPSSASINFPSTHPFDPEFQPDNNLSPGSPSKLRNQFEDLFLED